ncbi:calcium-binding protein [Phenylobacterium immobile]|uniref:calcium-binding protein n=1 Tax=Phenylobacterium immobile TaxID=21 RepID=UPI000A66AF13|nr:calcium-binding protein [Phenylobacterium immobile]
MVDYTGTPGNDVFTGGVSSDSALGGAGDDSLSGGGDTDILAGGAGADTLDGGAGNDYLFSGDVNPVYYGSPTVFDTGNEVDVLRGGDGSDVLSAGYGDFVDGGEGGGRLYISFMGAPVGVEADFHQKTLTIGGGVITNVGVAYVQGSNFADRFIFDDIFGSTASDVVHGMGGDDILVAGRSIISMFGGAGDDYIDARLGLSVFTIEGGDGADTIYANPTARVSGGAGADTIYGHGSIDGGAGDDKIYLQASEFNFWTVRGGDGADLIVASDIGHIIYGDAGGDTIIGGAAADNLSAAASGYDAGAERDSLSGGGGNDFLSIGYGDDADGGAGVDMLRLSLAAATAGVDIDAAVIITGASVTIGGGVIRNIETLVGVQGSNFNDVIRLGSSSFKLPVDGAGGDDLVIGKASSVSVLGGAGDDRFVSSTAADTFDGGAGVDAIDYSNATAGVTANLKTGSTSDGDTFSTVEILIGSNFADVLTGAGTGSTVNAGAGDDRLNLSRGDTAALGAGADVVVVASQSHAILNQIAITDWTADDRLQFSALTGAYAETTAATYNEAVTAAEALEAAGYNFVAIQVGADVYVFGEPVSDRLHFDAVVRLVGVSLDQVSASNIGLAGPIVTPTPTPTPVPTPIPPVSFAGTAGNDSFVGGGGLDTILGAGGDDTLAGGPGPDTLDGGEGSDRLYSGDIPPPYSYPYGNNPYSLPILETGAEFDVLRGGQGNDTLFAGYGDEVDGGADNDTLYISFMGAPTGVTADFRLPSQTIGGGPITSIESVGYLQGSNYGDAITLGAGAGYASGMGGADTIIGGNGTQGLWGNDGDDLLDMRLSNSAEFVDGGEGDDTLYASQGAARGGGGADKIYARDASGGAGDDEIVLQANGYSRGIGGEGKDIIVAAATGSAMVGDAGADTLTGGMGVDTLVSATGDDMSLERDVLSGGGEADELSAGYGDDVDGGAGIDTLRLSLGGATTGLDFDVAAINASTPLSLGGGVIQNIEKLVYLRGTEFDDVLRLISVPMLVTIDGGAGDDVIIAKTTVSVRGGAGDDRFVSSPGADTFDGGAGDDVIDYSAATTGVVVNLITNAAPAGDVLQNVEGVIGSAFADTLTGKGTGPGSTLIAGAGDDTVNLRPGDVASLGEGADVAMVQSSYYTNPPITITDWAAADKLRFGAVAGAYVELTAATYGDALVAAKAKAAAGYNFVAVQVSGDVYVFGDPMAGRMEFSATVVLQGANLNTVSADNVGMVGPLVTPVPTPTPTPVPTPTPTPPPVATTGPDTLTGTAGADVLAGMAGNDLLSGLAGDDQLNGGGGGDTMIGGPGNDVYIVDEPGDVVVEAPGEGYDRVDIGFSYSWNYALTDNVEVARVVPGTRATTMAGLTGNTLSNTMTGHDGANTLDGGAGNDTLVGGLGDDVYVIDSLQDVVIEAVNGGTDRVDVAFGGVYALGANIENARVVAAVGVRTDLVGSDLANVITGHDGANSLSGGGGDDILLPGAIDSTTAFDTVDGGAGDDTVELRGAMLSYAIERPNATDTTFVNTVTGERVLVRNIEVVKFADGVRAIGMLGGEGTAGDDLIVGTAGPDGLSGQVGADTIYGGGGDDVLNGGAGVDRLVGGLGNDRYIVDSPLDLVLENPGEGVDQIDVAAQTGGVYVLSANVENARIQASVANRVDIVGNGLANYVIGHDGLNSIDGADGDDLVYVGLAGPLASGGYDTVDGGAGTDTVKVLGAASAYNMRYLGAGAYEVAHKTTAERVILRNVEFLQFTDQKLAVTAIPGPTAGNDSLSGSGLIVGLEGDDTLTGGAGADTLDGGSGVDRLVGGGGADVYIVDRPEDVVIAGDGLDQVQVAFTAGGAYVLAAGVERATVVSAHLAIDLTGNNLANLLTGNNAANLLLGGAGVDTLIGGTGADTLDGGVGDDSLSGGLGDDVYRITNHLEVVVEAAGEGFDTIELTVTGPISYNTPNNVENLRLFGANHLVLVGKGNALANDISGHAGQNVLVGLEGDDILRPGATTGSSAIDTVDGGGGVDTVVVSGALSEYVITSYGGGQFTLTNVARSEFIRALSIEFIQFSDGLRPSAGFGTGSPGADTLNGSALGDLLDGAGGDDRVNGLGGADYLAGGSGNDTLDGGAEADTMVGGQGDDFYLVDTFSWNTEVPRDVVTESSGEGLDTIELRAGSPGDDFYLPDNVENLQVAAGFGGGPAVHGNALGNLLTGNEGDNALHGGAGGDSVIGGLGADTLSGGEGVDLLTGGAGADRFQLSGQGLDVISDFNPTDDTIELHLGVAIAGGDAAFRIGYNATWAQDATQRILYDYATGFLRYDPDGTGFAPSVVIGVLSNYAILTVADFVVV